jgi:hypothetical protein
MDQRWGRQQLVQAARRGVEELVGEGVADRQHWQKVVAVEKAL